MPAGAPKGNKNATRAKDWRDALKYALKNYDDSIDRGTALRAIGYKLIQMALDGDIGAIKEIGDRIDGKAIQYVDSTVREVTDAAELTDEELLGIASAGLKRIVEAKGGEEKPNSVH